MISSRQKHILAKPRPQEASVISSNLQLNAVKSNPYEYHSSSPTHHTNIAKANSYGGGPPKRIAFLKKAFTVIDKDASGFLSQAELKGFIHYYGIQMTQQEFNDIYNKCYEEDRGELKGKFTFLDLVDFFNVLEAKADQKPSTKENEIQSVFSVVLNDEDGDGKINYSEFLKANQP